MNKIQLIQSIMDFMILIIMMVVNAVFAVWPTGHLADSIEIGFWEKKECITNGFWFEQPLTIQDNSLCGI